MSYDKRMLVLLAGGYSTRLGIPKHTIRLTTGEYIFEALIKNVPCLYVTIITNRAYIDWWNAWLLNRGNKLGRRINILVEPHDNPDAGKSFGPTKYLTNNIPVIFANTVDEFVVSPIDSYYENYDFIEKLIKTKDDSIVIAKYPLGYIKQLSFVNTNWKNYVTQFIEKPNFISNDFLGGVTFTGMMKLKYQTLRNISAVQTENLGDLITELLNLKVKLKAIKCNTTFRDVGIEEIYQGLINSGILAHPPIARVGDSIVS